MKNMRTDECNNKCSTLKIKNYKCFQSDFAGFDEIKPINIIIGRNNSGKSSLIEMLDFVTRINRNEKSTNDFFDINTKFKAVLKLEEDNLIPFFRENRNTPEKLNHFGRHFRDKNIEVIYQGKDLTISFEDEYLKSFIQRIFSPSNLDSSQISTQKSNLAHVVDRIKIPDYLKNKIVRRLLSDRDIEIEKSFSANTNVNQDENKLFLEPNGINATYIIERFLNFTGYERTFVTDNLLTNLNSIMGKDANFTQILCQQHDSSNDSKWEIFLEEKKKGLIPLSKSGSGLKTIILVLINIILIPELDKKPIADYFFCFEELENNLHPALLKRLFLFINKTANEKNCHFFITTHSNVVIDLFSSNDNTQIVHVVKDSKISSTKTIDSYSDKKNILEDLGNKASDLLQANGIIWLEGPSDRIYLNKWIEIFSDPKLKEHVHYECAFYGGSILTHHCAEDPDIYVDKININNINSNAILIADSDKLSEDSELKERVKAIKEQSEKNGSLIWITKAKEIENYIPKECLEECYGIEKLDDIDQFELFYSTKKSKNKSYWKTNIKKDYNKVDLARKVVNTKAISKEKLEIIFDLKENIENICTEIEHWNDFN